MKHLEIFYDIISPYAYLGLELFSRSELYGKINFTLTPISLGTVLKATNNPGPANIIPKRKVALLDFCMQCTLNNIPSVGPPHHPFMPLPALRFIHCIEDMELRLKAALEINKECWAKGNAVDSEELITECLKNTDFFQEEWNDIYLFTKEKGGRRALKAATSRALELNVFGVPTFRYDEVNFWGSDRLSLLSEYINDPAKFKDNNYEKMLNTTPGTI